uniref:Uncharacterized protein n=1 Tax=Arundo donax TaxID=35708 RepID=A0A0A9EU31_ARUDO
MASEHGCDKSPAMNTWTCFSSSIQLRPGSFFAPLSRMVFHDFSASVHCRRSEYMFDSNIRAPWSSGSSLRISLAAYAASLAFLCILHAPRRVLHMTESGSKLIPCMNSTDSSSFPARPRRSTMQLWCSLSGRMPKSFSIDLK